MPKGSDPYCVRRLFTENDWRRIAVAALSFPAKADMIQEGSRAVHVLVKEL